MAETSSSAGKNFWSDHEIVVDKDGVPHYTGLMPNLMKEYRRRVLFAYASLEGDGDTPEKEQADLLKRQKRFALKLVNGLHGEAWKIVEPLVLEPDKLKKKDGYKEIFAALQKIEKETIIKKTEAFDKFFEQSTRKKGEALDGYLRHKVQAWHDLQDLDEDSKMSEDLLSYFILKGSNLSREDRRSVLLANKSTYTREGIEQALRISFHDLHEREKSQSWRQDTRKGFGKGQRRSYAAHEEDEEFADEAFEAGEDWQEQDDEDWQDEAALQAGEEGEEGAEVQSDHGASEDGEVYEAYMAMNKFRSGYKDARKKLRDVQKARGFFKPDAQKDRQQQIDREKQRTRCGACNRLGHWAGDPECPKAGRGGPGKGKSSGKGRGKSKGGPKGRAAYLVSSEPTLFNLGESDEEGDLVMSEAHCFMVKSEDEEAMPVDLGNTGYTDSRRKPAYSDASWEAISAVPMPDGGASSFLPPQSSEGTPPVGRVIAENQEVIHPKVRARVETVEVPSLFQAKPKNLSAMKVFELQQLCEHWSIQTSGTKQDLRERLETLFRGEAVPKKRCTLQFLRLIEEETEAPSPKPRFRQEEFHSKAPTYEPEGSRLFRSFAEEPPSSSASAGMPVQGRVRAKGLALLASMSAEKEAVEQRSELRQAVTLEDLQIGKPVDGLRCFECGNAMVLRANRSTGHRFFACTKFPVTSCGFTRQVRDGLDILNGEISGALRFPRGGR